VATFIVVDVKYCCSELIDGP